MTSRRKLLQAASTLALGGVFGRSAFSETLSRAGPNMTDSIPDIIFHNGEITTLDRANPVAHAVAIKDGKFLAVGSDQEVLALAGSATKVVDLKRRCVLPGLVDNHTHMVRGGLNYNL